MKAAVLASAGTLEVRDVEIAVPLAGEVLIRTSAVGLCHSDVHFIDGTLPMTFPAVLGHEAAGIVESVGDAVPGFAPGDRVVVSLVTSCGTCSFCTSGQQHLCRDQSIRVRGADKPPRLSLADGTPVYQGMATGAFAEKMLVHYSALVRVPEAMPLDLAALLGCAVSTGAGAVLHRAKVQAGQSVAVVGCGAVGLSAIAGAVIAGAGRVIAIDLAPDKLEKAKELGATDTINASDVDVVEAVLELTSGGVHHSIEAIGRGETMTQAVAMLRRAGTATLLGVLGQGATFALDGSMVLDEKRVQGAFMGGAAPVNAMPAYFDFYLAGRLPLESLVARRLPLDDIGQAVADLAAGQPGRQLMIFDN